MIRRLRSSDSGYKFAIFATQKPESGRENDPFSDLMINRVKGLEWSDPDQSEQAFQAVQVVDYAPAAAGLFNFVLPLVQAGQVFAWVDIVRS